MTTFGIPYQGSKTKMATTIHRLLPNGKRFVDLFGGGFAMSHSAYLLIPQKYEKVLYNELNPQLVELIKKAIAGDYSYQVFKPKWISREDFYRLKETNGYVRYVWSFSNAGKEYLFGKDKEATKKASHQLVVFGEKSNLLESICHGINNAVNAKTIPERRLQHDRYIKQAIKNDRGLQQLEQLQRLQRLQQLQQLERLQQLQQLEIRCGNYLDYEYQEGDVVYCDPPYESTAGYDEKNADSFNHKEFYDWVASRDFPVYFSSYQISDKRFKMIYAKRIRGLMGGAKGASVNFECLYSNVG